MNDKTEGIMSSLAVVLVLFTAMLDPRVSIAIAVILLACFSVYKFRRKASA